MQTGLHFEYYFTKKFTTPIIPTTQYYLQPTTTYYTPQQRGGLRGIPVKYTLLLQALPNRDSETYSDTAG